MRHVVALADGNIAPDASVKPIIKNLSLSVKAGESLGITGPSGSGKSTLIRLLLGIIRPLSGSVKIDGAELSLEVQRQYSAYIGYVPQNVELFDGTIAENIARFKEGSPDRVVEAAKLARAYELIVAMPEGFETKVGPGGACLSGGQKQRIALARALYELPPIIVLDEPTSNLDNEGRLALQQALLELKSMKRTVILIAHQPALFASMDKVAFIVDGQLNKFGPAKQILAEIQPGHAAVTSPNRTVTKERIAQRDDNSEEGVKAKPVLKATIKPTVKPSIKQSIKPSIKSSIKPVK